MYRTHLLATVVALGLGLSLTACDEQALTGPAPSLAQTGPSSPQRATSTAPFVRSVVARAFDSFVTAPLTGFSVDPNSGSVQAHDGHHYAVFPIEADIDEELDSTLVVSRFVVTRLDGSLDPVSTSVVELVSVRSAPDSPTKRGIIWAESGVLYRRWMSLDELASSLGPDGTTALSYQLVEPEPTGADGAARASTAKSSSSGGTCLVLFYIENGEIVGHLVLSCDNGHCDPNVAVSCGSGGGTSGETDEDARAWDWSVTGSSYITATLVGINSDNGGFNQVSSYDYRFDGTSKTRVVVNGFFNPVIEERASVFADGFVTVGPGNGTKVFDGSLHSVSTDATVNDSFNVELQPGSSSCTNLSGQHSGSVKTITGGWQPAQDLSSYDTECTTAPE